MTQMSRPPLQSDGPVILASGSRIRRALLENAGLAFESIPSDVDEDAVKAAILKDDAGTAADLAQILAEAKASMVSDDHAGAFVIGCDQTLEFEGAVLSKPETIEAARQQFLDLRGKTHQLHAAVTLIRDGETLWRHVETVRVTLRPFTPQCLGKYLAQAGPVVLESVGAYQIEGPGAHLMERIDGDFFAVLGLPLLPLLSALRDAGVLET